MITRAELETLLEGFGYEMVSTEECEIRDRVWNEFHDQPDAYGWAPLTVIEGEVVRDGR